MAKADFSRVLRELQKHGVLLQTDTQLPNVASLFAGEIVRGSWWTHAKAQQIFVGLNQLEDHEDVLFTKLLSGKVTLIHRRLWAELLSIALSREPWQTRKLSAAAKSLLKEIDAHGSLRSDKVELPVRFRAQKIGDVIRELENRLLIHAEEFHTESGAHAKQLETWQHWSDRVRSRVTTVELGEAKQVFENLVGELNNSYRGKARLPWA